MPLAGTAVAAWVAAEAGAATPEGPLAVAPDACESGGELAAQRVAYARCAAAVVFLAGDRIAVVPARACRIERGENLAGEPRDGVSADAAALDWQVLPPGAASAARLRAGLARSALTTGALEAVEQRVVEHARTRVQLGTAARLPVVRERLALIAEEVAAAAAALEVARFALASGRGDLAVPAAKIRSARAAGTVARLAHQLHGAIGVTAEHPLHHLTRRLWAWRDEDGAESAWARRLGESVVAAGPDEIWARLVAEDAGGERSE